MYFAKRIIGERARSVWETERDRVYPRAKTFSRYLNYNTNLRKCAENRILKADGNTKI